MRKVFLTLGILAVAACVYAATVGTSITVSESVNGDYQVATWSWTSDVSGDVHVTTSAAVMVGEIVRVSSDPGATAPTASWDFTILDQNGFDVCAGLGADRSATASESFVPYIISGEDGYTSRVCPVYVYGTLDLVVDNAGDNKTGTIRIYAKR